MSHAATPPLRPVLVRGEGVHLWDVDGHRYLDAISGAFCVQLGYGRADLARALSDAAGRLSFARPSVFESEESEAYARELLLAAGPPYARAVFTSSASEAVDAAIKAAHRYQQAVGNPARARVARLRGHFHGATLEALRVADYRPRRAPYEALLGGEPPALDPHAGAAFEEGIGDSAALIAETIPAVGLAAEIPPPGWLARMRRACDARGALWIADEALTGFGRVGPLFGWQRLAERPEDSGVTPDIVVFGKGAGAGYAAVGGILLAERVARALERGPGGPFTHAQTYGGHALACAVGRRVLAAMREESIEERVRSMEPKLRAALEPLSGHDAVRDVRGLGLLWGVTLRADRVAERIEALCRERGLLVYGGSGSSNGERGDHLLIAPALVSDPHHFTQIASGIRQVLDEVIRDTRSPGLSPT